VVWPCSIPSEAMKRWSERAGWKEVPGSQSSNERTVFVVMVTPWWMDGEGDRGAAWVAMHVVMGSSWSARVMESTGRRMVCRGGAVSGL
jgi:hypothetical protein